MTVSNERMEPDHDMLGKDVLMEIFRQADSSVVQELALRLIKTEKELLALRKAFSEPFCFTDDAGVSLRSHKSNFECSPVKFGNKDIPLYRKPTLP